METFDVLPHLLLNELQINAAMASVAKVKKRLHDTELNLNMEPSKNEIAEREAWNETVKELIERKEKLEFPTMDTVLSLQSDVQATNQNVVEEKAKKNRPKSTVEEQLEVIKNRELKRRINKDCKSFGPTPHGVVLRTFESYSGTNTTVKTTRKVIRRTPLMDFLTPSSSLPEWFCPQYYENVDPCTILSKDDIKFQAPFKTTSRDHNVSADLLRQKLKKRLLLKHPMGLSDSPYCMSRYSINNLDSLSQLNTSDGLEFRPSTSSLQTKGHKFGIDRISSDSLISATLPTIQIDDFVTSMNRVVAPRIHVRDFTFGALEPDSTSLIPHNVSKNEMVVMSRRNSDGVVNEKQSHDDNQLSKSRSLEFLNSSKTIDIRSFSVASSGMAAEFLRDIRKASVRKQSNMITMSAKLNHGESKKFEQPKTIALDKQIVKKNGASTLKTIHTPSIKIHDTYSFSVSNKKNEKILPPTSPWRQNRGPNYHRDCTTKGIFSRYTSPLRDRMKRKKEHALRSLIYNSTSYKPGGSSGVDYNSEYDDIDSDELGDDQDSNNQLTAIKKFECPSIEQDVRPLIKNWYVNRELYTPDKPKRIQKKNLLLPGGISLDSPSFSSITPEKNNNLPIPLLIVSSTNEIGIYAQTYSSAIKSMPKTHEPSAGRSSPSLEGMNGLLLEDREVDKLIKNQLFTSPNEIQSLLQIIDGNIIVKEEKKIGSMGKQKQKNYS